MCVLNFKFSERFSKNVKVKKRRNDSKREEREREREIFQIVERWMFNGRAIVETLGGGRAGATKINKKCGQLSGLVGQVETM